MDSAAPRRIRCAVKRSSQYSLSAADWLTCPLMFIRSLGTGMDRNMIDFTLHPVIFNLIQDAFVRVGDGQDGNWIVGDQRYSDAVMLHPHISRSVPYDEPWLSGPGTRVLVLMVCRKHSIVLFLEAFIEDHHASCYWYCSVYRSSLWEKCWIRKNRVRRTLARWVLSDLFFLSVA